MANCRKAADKQHQLDPLTSVFPKLTAPGYKAICVLYLPDGLMGSDRKSYRAGAWYGGLNKHQQTAFLDKFSRLFYLKLYEYAYDGFDRRNMDIWSNMKKIIWVGYVLADAM